MIIDTFHVRHAQEMKKKTLNYWSRGKYLVLFSPKSRCFLRQNWGQYRDSREIVFYYIAEASNWASNICHVTIYQPIRPLAIKQYFLVSKKDYIISNYVTILYTFSRARISRKLGKLPGKIFNFANIFRVTYKSKFYLSPNRALVFITAAITGRNKVFP